MERRILCINLKLLFVLAVLVLAPSGVSASTKIRQRRKNTFSRTYYHDFVVKYTPLARLCEKKNILSVNGQFPGPTLRAHRWDTLVVNVHNQAQHNITIHWHGVRQLRDPWSDGASYITQCPIRPGQNFTYTVRLTEEEGTVWWHAHDHAARATVHGAIVVFPRPGTTYPFPKPHKEVSIILGEWWEMDVLDIYEAAAQTGEDPTHSDAYTINGQPGYLYSCSKPEETFKMQVEQGKTYLLRVINAAMEEQLFFAVAGHRLTLVGTDGSYTEPLATDHIMISPGQTMDLLLLADQPPGDYAMAASPFDSGMGSMHRRHTSRANGMGRGSMPPTAGTNNATTGLFQYAVGSSSSSAPTFPSLPSYNDSHSANSFTSRIRGRDRAALGRVADERMFVVLSMNTMGSTSGGGGMAMAMATRKSASMNNISFAEPRGADVLGAYYRNVSGVYEEDFPGEPARRFDYTGDRAAEEEMWPPERGTKAKVVEYGRSVEVVLQAASVTGEESHPMHFHGHSFYVVGWGFGNFDPEKDPLKYNLVNPPKQSTFAVPKGGWAVIRFRADNPGVWLLHCHFEHHHFKGMSMVYIVKDGQHLHTRLRHPPKNLPTC
ncbi:laccase-14-like [Iris pallida]|uniref:laccase n=1 Tax=Iris pallida TaxID=29817 RepID=A0AAX6I234_IRIPA|nr:laccase-14-like [Iris pallida]